VPKTKSSNAVLQSLLDVFSEVEDPRVARTRAHPLVNVLTMALLGAMAGADGWEALEAYAEEQQEFFETFLDMPYGTPSADTFRRVFEAMNPQAFHEAFRSWLEPLLGRLEGQTIALDGKTLRGALAHSRGRGGAFHLLHVWATEQRLLLGQSAVETAGHESSAAVELLSRLHLEGATVTADAASCTAPVTEAIRAGGAHYVLALKGNQAALQDYVVERFDSVVRAELPAAIEHDNGHGRVEHRIVRALPVGTLPENIKAPWVDLKSIVEVLRIRSAKEVTFARSFYVTSHPPKAKQLAAHIRDHWKIENELHHVLDVTFGEDRRKIRSEFGAQNFALVCRHALSLIKRDPRKMSVAMKKRRAMWNPGYCLELLSRGFHEV
jgi:predicted transposase YbfD/YdcC